MTDRQRLAIGQMNRLQAVKTSGYGLFLDGYHHGEILLPKRYVPADVAPGDWLDVFVYTDSEDRPIATTDKPKAMVGEVAMLKVAAINQTGAFLDWGLTKDLLLPYSEQAENMREGYTYCVYLYLDSRSDRVVASTRLSKFLPEHSATHSPGQAVELLACSKSELGFKCLIDRQCLGLLHHGDVFQPLQPGQTVNGFIKAIRPDGRIDLSLTAKGNDAKDTLESQILEHLKASGGSAEIGDKTPPEEIYRLFHCSKKNFKRALSALYKARKIVIEGNQVRTLDAH